MLRTGQRNKDINEALGVSVLTVNTHAAHLPAAAGAFPV